MEHSRLDGIDVYGRNKYVLWQDGNNSLKPSGADGGAVPHLEGLGFGSGEETPRPKPRLAPVRSSHQWVLGEGRHLGSMK